MYGLRTALVNSVILFKPLLAVMTIGKQIIKHLLLPDTRICQWLASLPTSGKGAKRLFVGKEQNRRSCSTNNLSQQAAVYIYILAAFLFFY
jgi:hypothetical protein